MDKRFIRIAAIALILILVAGVYIAKNYGEIAGLKDAVSLNAGDLQAGNDPLESASFDRSMIEDNELPLILVLGSDTCGPCMRMLPDLETLREIYAGKVDVAYLDINDNPEVMYSIPVRVTPTIAVFMPDGKPFVPAEGNKIPFILYSDRNTGEHMVTVAEGALPLDMLRALAEELLVD